MRSAKAKRRGAARPAVPVRATPERAKHLLVTLALCTLALLAYSNSFHTAFVLDNKGLLLNNPRIREVTPANLALIFQHTYWWPTGEAGLYRPFTTLSWLLNYAILGDQDNPAGYHWINFFLHSCNVLLVYALALALVRWFWPSVLIAALWAVYPVLTESVTNIIGRADLLAAMAVLSGLLLYLKSSTATGWRRWAGLVGLTAVTTIGVFSKESAVAILPVLVLYELVWRKTRPRTFLIACLATALPIAAMLYQRSRVLAASPRAEFPYTDNPIVGADWWTGRLTAIKVIAHYLWLTIWPAQLSSDYSFNQIPLAHGAFQDRAACIAVLAALIGVAFLYRWNRTAFFFACFGFLNLVPVSNLLFPIGTIMAERLLYLPSVGFVACVALIVYALANRTGKAYFAPLVLSLIVAIFAARTWTRNLDWQTDLTLATATVRASPNSFKTHRLLASALFDSDSQHANIERVIEEEEKSLTLLRSLPPENSRPEAYRLAGYYYLLQGDQMHDRGLAVSASLYRKAIEVLLQAISIDHISRAAYRARAGSAPVSPDGDSEAYLLLSIAWLRTGDPAGASRLLLPRAR